MDQSQFKCILWRNETKAIRRNSIDKSSQVSEDNGVSEKKWMNACDGK